MSAREDLGETRLPRRGRSLGGPPPRPPQRRPPDFRVLYCKYGMPGARAGEFLLGAAGVMMFATGRGRKEVRASFEDSADCPATAGRRGRAASFRSVWSDNTRSPGGAFRRGRPRSSPMVGILTGESLQGLRLQENCDWQRAAQKLKKPPFTQRRLFTSGSPMPLRGRPVPPRSSPTVRILSGGAFQGLSLRSI